MLERFPSVIALDDRAALQSSPEWRRALRSAAVLLVDQVALAVFRRGGTASVEHLRPRAGPPWGRVLTFLRAPVRAPTCLAPGDPEVAAMFAGDLDLPEPVLVRARAGRTPLGRTVPAGFRCEARP